MKSFMNANEGSSLTELSPILSCLRTLNESEALWQGGRPQSFKTVSFQDLKDEAKISSKDGFCFIVSLQDGSTLYMSSSITIQLGYPKDMLKGQSIMNYLYQKDHITFANHLTQGLNACFTQGKNYDSYLVPNSFYCRLRVYHSLKFGYNISEKVAQYLPFKVTLHINDLILGDICVEKSSSTLCVKATATPVKSVYTVPKEVPAMTSFSTRHTASCHFSHVDASAIPFLGYLPQDMIGYSVFDFYHEDDMSQMKDIYELVVKERGASFRSRPYRFKAQNGSFITLETEWSSFINPWSWKLEFVIGQHRVLKGPSDVNIFNICEIQELNLADEIVKKTIGIQNEIKVLLSQSIKNAGADKSKRICNKRKLDLAAFVFNSIDEEYGNNRLKHTQKQSATENNEDNSDLESVVMGDISTYKYLNDSSISSETPSDAQRIHREENLERYFASQPKTYSNSSDEANQEDLNKCNKDVLNESDKDELNENNKDGMNESSKTSLDQRNEDNMTGRNENVLDKSNKKDLDKEEAQATSGNNSNSQHQQASDSHSNEKKGIKSGSNSSHLNNCSFTTGDSGYEKSNEQDQSYPPTSQGTPCSAAWNNNSPCSEGQAGDHCPKSDDNSPKAKSQTSAHGPKLNNQADGHSPKWDNNSQEDDESQPMGCNPMWDTMCHVGEISPCLALTEESLSVHNKMNHKFHKLRKTLLSSNHTNSTPKDSTRLQKAESPVPNKRKCPQSHSHTMFFPAQTNCSVQRPSDHMKVTSVNQLRSSFAQSLPSVNHGNLPVVPQAGSCRPEVFAPHPYLFGSAAPAMPSPVLIPVIYMGSMPFYPTIPNMFPQAGNPFWPSMTPNNVSSTSESLHPNSFQTMTDSNINDNLRVRSSGVTATPLVATTTTTIASGALPLLKNAKSSISAQCLESRSTSACSKFGGKTDIDIETNVNKQRMGHSEFFLTGCNSTQVIDKTKYFERQGFPAHNPEGGSKDHIDMEISESNQLIEDSESSFLTSYSSPQSSVKTEDMPLETKSLPNDHMYPSQKGSPVLSSEISHRYEMPLPNIDEILRKDLKALQSMNQPDLLNKQLRMLKKEFAEENQKSAIVEDCGRMDSVMLGLATAELKKELEQREENLLHLMTDDA